MWIEQLWDRWSLRARLLSTYLVILGIGGLVTSLIGSWIVSSAIMAQMHRTLSHNLGTAGTIYDQRLLGLNHVVRLTAFGPSIEHFLAAHDTIALREHLDRIRRDNGLDFLTLTDADGRVLACPTSPGHVGNDASSLGPVKTALGGQNVAATEVLSPENLAGENPALGERARAAVGSAAGGLVMMAAAPVRAADARVSGALYGGILLNHNHEVVDSAWNILFTGEEFHGKVIGEVSIFRGDECVSTTVKRPSGARALGKRALGPPGGSAEDRGAPHAYDLGVSKDGYVGSHQPIRNHAGEIVGAIHVGVLEQVYTSMRDRVILSFFALATAGFFLIIIVTDYMVRQITRPIGEIVAATRNLAAGRFDQEVRVDRKGEIALLAQSFNQMLRSLRQMKADLEEWGSTLEDKVQQRTEQLIAMQNRVAQSEKLASLGMLSAGVAHEINNPLGGILSLTALALEDLPPNDPVRPNLEEVVRQSERCREIVKGLLEFSRQQEAGSDLIDVRNVIDDTLALMGKQALFFNVKVTKKYAAEVPMVLADRSQLQQVFINTIMNAVQAMGEHGELTVEVGPAADAQVEIAIADTGCGIPAADLARVFDPFYTTKPEGQGTGLGLSIAYGIVTKHNGTISIASEPGKGTVVTIRLPASAVAAEESSLETDTGDRPGELTGRR
jgi:two-component system NtrC family sensor kinase